METIREIEDKMNRSLARMERVDLERIYARLKDKYDLLLTNSLALEDGFDDDFPVLTGKNAEAKFCLYFSCGIVFDVEDLEGTAGTHWHPSDTDEAMQDVVDFMEGRCRCQLYPYRNV